MVFMFEGCSSLKKIDISNFNTKKNLFIFKMFDRCSSLKEIISNSNLANLFYTQNIFQNELKNINIIIKDKNYKYK